MSEYIVDFGSLAMLSRIVESESNRLGEPVVRCRDCVNYQPYRTHRHGMMNRCYDEHGHTHKRDENDFCSRGERRGK